MFTPNQIPKCDVCKKPILTEMDMTCLPGCGLTLCCHANDECREQFAETKIIFLMGFYQVMLREIISDKTMLDKVSKALEEYVNQD